MTGRYALDGNQLLLVRLWSKSSTTNRAPASSNCLCFACFYAHRARTSDAVRCQHGGGRVRTVPGVAASEHTDRTVASVNHTLRGRGRTRKLFYSYSSLLPTRQPRQPQDARSCSCSCSCSSSADGGGLRPRCPAPRGPRQRRAPDPELAERTGASSRGVSSRSLAPPGGRWCSAARAPREGPSGREPLASSRPGTGTRGATPTRARRGGSLPCWVGAWRGARSGAGEMSARTGGLA
jgi:hypothetical protein